MRTGVGAPTEHEINTVNSAGMNNGEDLSTGLGVCAYFGRVMAKLEDMTRLLERRFLEK